MQAVWRKSGAKGNARLILLAIADYAHDDGSNAYPSVATLMQKTLLSERTIQNNISELKNAGELEVKPKAGPRGVNLYTVVVAKKYQAGVPTHGGTPQNLPPADSTGYPADSHAQVAPEPLLTQEEQELKEATNVASAPERRRNPSKAEAIAYKHLEPIIPTINSGYGFDLYQEITKVWDGAMREAEENDVEAKQVGKALVAAYIYAMTEEYPTNWPLMARLVNTYGKIAIYGVREAYMRAIDQNPDDIDGWFKYAVVCCREKKRELDAKLAAREEGIEL